MESSDGRERTRSSPPRKRQRRAPSADALLDAAFWRKGFDGMHCCDDAWLENEIRLLEATCCGDDALARDGATTIAGDERCAALAQRCASAIEALAELRLPAVFVFMFDESWALVRAHEAAVATQMPRNAKLNYDIYAWRVPYGSRGWAAHRDRDSCPTVDSNPCYATVWIALTDVLRDTSCIWYAPLSQTLLAGDDPLSLQRAAEPVAEPLPVKPGGAAVWGGSTVHYGGAHTNEARGPRISLALAVSTPEMQDDEERVSAVRAWSGMDEDRLAPSLLEDRPAPSILARLKLVCLQLHFYSDAAPLDAELEELLDSLDVLFSRPPAAEAVDALEQHESASGAGSSVPPVAADGEALRPMVPVAR